MALDWKKASDYHLESGCGRYTVSKTKYVDLTRYTAWRRGDGKLKPAESLGQFDNPKDAKTCAENHAAARRP